MAHKLNKLTARTVATVSKPGLYADGGGLYLRVGRGGARNWCLRFMLAGKAREMGLGGLSKVSLAEARKKATEHRLHLADKVDPIERRKAESSARKIEAARAMTFEQCAEAYIAAHRAGWRNPKHAGQWGMTLTNYAGPVMGALPVQAIDTALVMKVIEPLWTIKPETASRLRGRIERVLDWAKVRGYRDGENPARWRGYLDHQLPARGKVRRVKHHAALHYAELPGFMVALREQQGVAARALEFTILTAARTGEVIGARWCEIDFANRVWTIPGDRMKGGREHRIPLSKPALAVLEHMWEQDGELIFPGLKPGKPLSNMAMLILLARVGRGDVTVHGFRSTFRDWAAERTTFAREVAEMALAHAIPDAVEAAYRRGDLFDKRRRLMDAWAAYCGNVEIDGVGKLVSLANRKTNNR